MLQEKYKYKKIIKIALCTLIVSLLSIHSSNSFAEFNANQALDQLSILQDQLNNKNTNERNIKNIREESTQLRASALNCIDEVDPQVQSLKLEVKQFEQIDPGVNVVTFERLTKKEALQKTRLKDKLERSLGGIKDMGGLPDAMFVIDVQHERIAIQEANKLGIPVIALCSTDCNISSVDYPIPGNDTGVKSISYVVDQIVAAYESGKKVQ